MFQRYVGPAAWALGAALVLLGATGATATPSTTSSPTVQASPVDRYLDAVYGDLFGRDVDPVGRATWTAALDSGTPRRAVADAITGSEEFRSGLIVDAYQTYLQREPDAAGLRFWLDQMATGMTIQQLKAGFVASDEYVARLGTGDWYYFVTQEAWIRTVYEDVLGRTASDPDIEFWMNRLTGGGFHICHGACPAFNMSELGQPKMSRQEISLAFLMSTERLSADLDGDYQWLLGRDLDPSGQRTWVAQLQGGVRYEAVIGSIVASDEYWALSTS